MSEAINQILQEQSPILYSFLSKRGKDIFFPAQGIMAQAKDAKGKKINATIGIALNNDATPTCLPSLEQSVPSRSVFPYAPSYGFPAIRTYWKERIQKNNPLLTTLTTLPIPTNGITHALSIVGYLFMDENDSLLLPDLFWGNYKLIFEKTYGGKLTPFNFFKENVFDLEALDAAIQQSGEKIMLLLNFPNNPSGYSPTKEEAKEIITILEKNANAGKKILIICDDAYFGLTYEDNTQRESLFALLSSLHQNIIAIKADGATKEDFVWGFRLGFLTIATKNLSQEVCDAIENKIAGAIRATVSNVSNLSQQLLLKASKNESFEHEKQEKYQLLKTRYTLVREIVQEEKYQRYFTSLPFNAGYFMCIRVREPLQAEAIRQQLLTKYDTGVIATKNLLRIAFSSVPTDQIKELFENIYSACCDLSPQSS